MEETIRQKEIGFVVIDSLTTWIDGQTDTNKFNEMSRWLKPFKGIAQRTGCGIGFVRHKQKGGGKGCLAGLGSVAQTALFRSELFVTTKDGETRYVERMKGNAGKTGGQLAYSIVSVEGNEASGSWSGARRLLWLLVRRPRRRRNSRPASSGCGSSSRMGRCSRRL